MLLRRLNGVVEGQISRAYDDANPYRLATFLQQWFGFDHQVDATGLASCCPPKSPEDVAQLAGTRRALEHIPIAWNRHL
jgi:hypothetical protein